MAQELRCCLGHSEPPVLVWHLKNDPDLVRCPRCGMVFLRSVPSADPLEPYGEEYFANYARFNKDFQREAELLLGRIGAIRRPPGKFVDIGAGLGYHVRAATERGWNASGIEPSTWAVDRARKERVALIQNDADHVTLEPETYDVVLINHTLEHVSDPAGLLRRVRTAIAPGGILVVGVPNWNGILRYVMGRRWPMLAPKHHLWHFTTQTLRLLLERAGYRITSLTSDRGFPRPAIGFRPTPKMLWNEFLKAFYFFHRIGMGEALFAVAQRVDGVTEAS